MKFYKTKIDKKQHKIYFYLNKKERICIEFNNESNELIGYVEKFNSIFFICCWYFVNKTLLHRHFASIDDMKQCLEGFLKEIEKKYNKLDKTFDSLVNEVVKQWH
jgi:hypothetical protein